MLTVAFCLRTNTRTNTKTSLSLSSALEAEEAMVINMHPEYKMPVAELKVAYEPATTRPFLMWSK